MNVGGYADMFARLASRAVPFAGVCPLLRRRLTAVFYHVVSDEVLPHVSNLYRYRNTTTFRRDMEFFVSRFNFVSYGDIVIASRGAGVLPPYPLFLSFDDGHREVSVVVAPVLKAMGIPATFFVTTSVIDNRDMIPAHQKLLCLEKAGGLDDGRARVLARKVREITDRVIPEQKDSLLGFVMSIHDYNRDGALLDSLTDLLEIDTDEVLARQRPYLTTGQLKGLLRDGFTLGSHSHHHIKFEYLSEEEREGELATSVRFLRDCLGVKTMGFSFPNSSRGVEECWMADMVGKYPEVDIFFNTDGFHGNSGLLVNRVSLDEPVAEGEDFSTFHARRILARSFMETCRFRGQGPSVGEG